MKKGKAYFFVLASLAIIEQVVLMITVYNKIGNGKLTVHLAKLTILILLLSIIYFKGNKIAIWLLSAWYVFGGILAFGEIKGNFLSIYLGMFIFYLGFAFVLNLFPPISKFIESKRG